jgi:tight adherence protein B
MVMGMQTIAVAFLAAVAVGGVAWVFIYPILSGERATERRMDSVAKAEPARRTTSRTQARPRREQIEETLKELEARSRQQNRPPLSTRIAQAGLGWTKQKFMIVSGLLGGVACLIGFIVGGILPALGLAFAGALGLPMWLLKFLKKRRETKFLEHFPDSVDIIVRGVKAGLPLLDSMKVIVADAPEPIRSEFRTILETQAIGIPLGEACSKLYERIPLAEANFFGIVIAIQQKAGGNLSEALGNLSRVLRDRKRMKAKIHAMSMEAKASGAIIGALPLAVMTLVYLTSPDYISLLWTDGFGHVMLAVSAAWMCCGILVMKKMINFDF